MELPTLFISHGSPMFALQPGRAGAQLTALGAHLPKPRAVLVLSPHWMTRDFQVLGAAQPETIHDFGGFPETLYGLDYPAPGAPDVAAEVVSSLAGHGIDARIDTVRGRDHGAWVPLMHLFPGANVPVLQLSQPRTPSPLILLELGRAVSNLRSRGLLIVGSGSLTHNLRDIGADETTGAYAGEFANWVAARIAEGDLHALLDYRAQAPSAQRAHPTDEHFLPLFFAIGAANARWTVSQRIGGDIVHGALSMDSFIFADITAPAGELDSGTQLTTEPS